MAETINITRHINESRPSHLLTVVLACCGVVTLLDGLDTWSIGVAAPFIADALAIKMPDFGAIFSAASLGAALGALSFGFLADRFGRKTPLIVATVFIGVFTMLTPFATSPTDLIVYRFLAGVGLGGATPCVITMTSEYAPARSRAAAVTLLWAAFPLGGVVGSLFNAFVLAEFGWRAIFYIGGILPFFAAVAVAVAMPESIKFLIARRNDQPAVRRIFQRLSGGAAPADARFVLDEERLSNASMKHLFMDGRLMGTLLLWAIFFVGYSILTVIVLWTPALLRANGISPSAAALVVAINGLGGIVGNSVAGRLIQRFGVNSVMAPAFAIGAAATVGLGFGASSFQLAASFMALIGLFIGAATAGALALASIIYPTAIRSTGAGWGLAAGRFGQVASPLVAGGLLGAGFGISGIMVAFASSAVLAAVFVLLFSAWASRRLVPADEAVPGALPTIPAAYPGTASM